MRTTRVHWPVRPVAYAICVVLFAVHQVAERLLGWRNPFVDSYLDPLLAIPLLLGLAALERWWLRGRGRVGWRGFSAVEVAAMTLALALVFEEVFPRLDPLRQVRDPYDYLAYALGGGLYYTFVGIRLGGVTRPESD